MDHRLASDIRDDRPPSRLSLRPRGGRYDSPTGMHSPLLALDEDEFGGSRQATVSHSAWSDLKHAPEQVPGWLSDAWESPDDDGGDDDYDTAACEADDVLHGQFHDQEHQHPYRRQQDHPEQRPQWARSQANGSYSAPNHQHPTNFDTQPIHPPHQDWQHSGNLQDMRNSASIDKLSQEVGRLSYQLQELMGQFQSLRSSVTLTASALPTQASPGRGSGGVGDVNASVTHDLNDQLLRSHVQERLAEKLKQLLLSDEQPFK